MARLSSAHTTGGAETVRLTCTHLMGGARKCLLDGRSPLWHIFPPRHQMSGGQTDISPKRSQTKVSLCCQVLDMWAGATLSWVEDATGKKSNVKPPEGIETSNGAHLSIPALAGSWAAVTGIWTSSKNVKVQNLETNLRLLVCQLHGATPAFKHNSRIDDITFVVTSAVNQFEEKRIMHTYQVRDD